MKKVTEQTCRAFIAGDAIRSGNTEVRLESDGVALYLHGSAIATRPAGESLDNARLSFCGHQTATTKERLNGLLQLLGLPGFNIKGGQLFYCGHAVSPYDAHTVATLRDWAANPETGKKAKPAADDFPVTFDNAPSNPAELEPFITAAYDARDRVLSTLADYAAGRPTESPWAEYPAGADLVDDGPGSYRRITFAGGGPQYELRIRGGAIEFVYLDWFVGIGFDVSSHPGAQWASAHLMEIRI